MTRFVLVALALLGLSIASPASAQSEGVEWRIQNIAGVDPARFRQFFDEVQSGLGRGDRRHVCAVVQYPLKQWRGDVTNASECEARFGDIFAPDVVEDVVTQKFDALFVNSGGIGTDHGFWMSGICQDNACATDYVLRIISVSSRRDDAYRLNPPRGYIFVKCVAGSHRIEVSSDGRNRYRLRSWPVDAPETSRPGFEAINGTRSSFGTSGCSGTTWTFAIGRTRVMVTEGGCYPDSSPPPIDTVAQLDVEIPNLLESSLWCSATTKKP